VRKPLWQPSLKQISASRLTQFIEFLEEKHTVLVGDFHGLYQWSISHAPEFWSAFWDFAGIVASHKGDVAFVPHKLMRKSQFFPDARLNYAENLLQKRGDGVAIIARNEQRLLAPLTHGQLYDQVSQCVQALKAAGVGAGSRVAGVMPNIPETVVAMLATASLGGVWCVCSPDFGAAGVLDRFGQIEPTVLITVDGYVYGGKSFDILEKVQEIQERLPTLQKTLVVPYLASAPDLSSLTQAINWNQALAAYAPQDITFEQVPFNHPLFIMFTSGTTGVPKCIVHGVGGTLLQHVKEHQLHCDVHPQDRVFYFTTCGWMMWNWQVSALASGATVALFDGAPMFPNPQVLFDYVDEAKITLFGVSAKYIDVLKKENVCPGKTHDLSSVRLITSTGSPLMEESYDYVYEKIKRDVSLASISGGTDIVSCFVLGAIVLPVWRGEIQTRGLGLSVEVFDERGRSVRGQKGELVCTKPFPCMPIGFWNDPDGQKYHEAYFNKYPNVWCHGDLIELKEDGGLVIYGRSDTVLNPGGVRIGTGEIYRQVEQVPEVLESLVVGQEWDNDVRIILFVKLVPEAELDDVLIQRIKKQIRLNASPRHMPAKIIQVADIPRTKSGKIVELAVRNIIHGQPVVNVEALANPGALESFKNLPELDS
jgi:acetoacetyl-CoA synthetase